MGKAKRRLWSWYLQSTASSVSFGCQAWLAGGFCGHRRGASATTGVETDSAQTIDPSVTFRFGQGLGCFGSLAAPFTEAFGNSTSIIGVVRSQGADKGEVTDGYSLVRLVCSMATSVDAGCPWSCPSSWCARRERGERSRRTGAFISCLPVRLKDVSRAARFPGGIAKWCRSLSLRANTGG